MSHEHDHGVEVDTAAFHKPKIRITVFDPDTGDTQVAELDQGGFILICGERMELTHEQRYATGTVQLTIKPRQR